MWDRVVRLGRRSRTSRRLRDHFRRLRLRRAAYGKRGRLRGNGIGERNRRDGVLDIGVQFQFAHFILNLRLEFAAGALEFRQAFADLPPDLRQLLRPKQDQGQNEDEHHLWETQIHSSIITLVWEPGNCGSF